MDVTAKQFEPISDLLVGRFFERNSIKLPRVWVDGGGCVNPRQPRRRWCWSQLHFPGQCVQIEGVW